MNQNHRANTTATKHKIDTKNITISKCTEN